MKILLKKCRLISELSGGYSAPLGDVLVTDDKIAKISPEISAEADQTIDCQGKTLMPGLFDLHMHLNWSYTNGERNLTDFSIFTKSCFSARKYLELGITTIRDMGSPKRVSAAVRDAIRQGLFTGPRVISGGIILRPLNNSVPADPYHFLRYVSGADEMTRFVREEIGGGADWVKLYVNGNPADMLPEEVHAAVRTAAILGKKVAAHCHSQSAIHLCLDEGVTTIEHGSYIDAAGIEKLKQGNSFLVPTLSTLAPEVTPSGFTQDMIDRFIKPLLKANIQNISAAYEAGLLLGFGTDTPVEQLEQHPGLEFKMRSEYLHMKPLDILLQATRNSAKILGLDHITGQLLEGYSADLILIDGKPDEDISAMYQKPELVFAAGKLYYPSHEAM